MPQRQLRAACLALSLLAAGAAQSAEPQMVTDLDPRSTPEDVEGRYSYISSLGTANGRTLFYFSGASERNAAQSALWSSDGTLSGTQRLSETSPYTDSSAYRTPVVSTGRLAFYLSLRQATEEEVHVDLWRTDGTVEGTFPVADTGPFKRTPALAAFGARAFFTSCGPLGCEPWMSDGTPAGTHLLRDLTPGLGGSEPREPVTFQGALYFLATAPEGTVLWRSDGTRRGTVRILTLPTGVPAGSLTATPERLYFSTGAWSGRRGGTRATLWTSDGTAAGTRPIPPFATTSPGGPSFVDPLGAVAGRFYFRGWEPAARFQLWSTDGTAGGTVRLVDLGVDPYAASLPTVLGARAYFLGPGGGIWSTRGTRASTRQVTSCRAPCSEPLRLFPGSPAPLAVGNRLLLLGRDEASGYEPWVSDGTRAGTHRLADTCRGSCSGYPELLAATPDRVYFTVNYRELWSTDGTEAGTIRLTRLDPPLDAAAQARGAILVPPSRRGEEDLPGAKASGLSPLLVFAQFDTERGSEIWRSDGTVAGTELVRRLSNGASSNPSSLTSMAGKVFFNACVGGSGVLWTSRGGAADTQAFFTDDNCYVFSSGLTAVGNRIYFNRLDETGLHPQIWSTDGTAEGTRQLTHFDDERYSYVISSDFRGGLLLLRTEEYGRSPQLWRIDPVTEQPSLLVEPPSDQRIWTASATPDRIFFTQEDAEFQLSFWISDGTEAGTRRLANFPRGTESAYPFDPTQIGDVNYVRISEFTSSEIWRTDGTPAGTRRLFPHPDAPVPVENPLTLVGLGGSLLILDQPYDSEGVPLSLLRSDGTVAGTRLLKVLSLGRSRDVFAPPPSLLAGGSFYFLAATPEEGEELWRTDGTAAGTVLVRDIAPGPADAKIQNLRFAGGRLAFSADDGVHGAELWTSDGTAAGTRREGDIAPGPAPSTPVGMTAAGGWLFFNADDGVHGRELWKLPLEPINPGGAAAPLRLQP